jgi:hypothetical protein
VLGVTVAIVVALSIAGGVYVLSSSPSSTTTTVRTTSQTASATTNGIKLSTSINATELNMGQILAISISLSNTLPKVNAINTSANWPFNGVAVQLWPYCYGVPARIAILQGNYSIQELPAVTNVTFPFTCSGGAGGISSATFQPNSDQVNLNGNSPPYLLSLNFTTSGYYDLANLSQQSIEPVISQPGEFYVPRDMPSAISFAPGVYTVAVADEWGGYNILHFEVSP